MAELFLILGFAQSIRALFAFAEIADAKAADFLPSPLWWIAFWTCLRFSIGIASLIVARPSLWFLPLLAGLWELKHFAGAVGRTSELMSDYASELGNFDFGTLFAVFGHFWVASLFPVVLLPILGLQAWWLFAERGRRHAV